MSLQHLFTKIVHPNTITFKNTVSLENVEKIIFFKETGETGVWLTKQFRYSWDQSIWSEWATLSQQALMSIDFNNQLNFWLEVVYDRENYTTAQMGDWYLFYDGVLSVDDPSILVNADTLQGKDGQYYLTRSNHVGPYTDLYFQNLPLSDVCTGGVYSHKKDTSLSTTHYFKSIGGTDGIWVREVSDNGYNKLMIGVNASVGSGENVGDGDASILFQSLNSDSGSTTLKFRELKSGEGNWIIAEVSNNLVI